jgi:hypothetical protein
MTHSTTFNSNKSTKLSDQVNYILHEKGFSFLFNWSDYQYFKEQAKTAFNKAFEIADLFIQNNEGQNSDFSEYVF